MAKDISNDIGYSAPLHATNSKNMIAHADEVVMDAYDDKEVTGEIDTTDNVVSAVKKLNSKINSKQNTLQSSEDITIADNTAQIADRTAIEDGRMGYKIIRDTIADADTFSTPNTIYEIRGKVDLNKLTISIASNCTLEFKGGSLSNGTLSGKIKNKYVYPEWFGAKADGVTDDTDAINRAIAVSNAEVIFRSGTYCISSTLNIQDCFVKVERAATIKAVKEMDYMVLFNFTDGSLSDVIQRRPALDGFGIIDGNGKAKYCISNKYSTVSITNILLENATTAMIRCIASDTNISGSVNVYNVKCINVLKLDGVIGIDVNKSDCIFNTVSTIDCPIFASVSAGNTHFIDCHPWLSDSKFWADSVVIDVNTNDYISCVNVEADSMRSLVNIHQDYSIVDLINCQFYINNVVITDNVIDTNPPITINKNGFGNCSITVIGGRYYDKKGQFQSADTQYDTVLKSYNVFRSKNNLNVWTPTIGQISTVTAVDKIADKPAGLLKYLTSDYGRVIYFDGVAWKDTNGNSALAPIRGGTNKRVSQGIYPGFTYFDTDLNRPVYWNGTKWIDPTESIGWATIE